MRKAEVKTIIVENTFFESSLDMINSRYVKAEERLGEVRSNKERICEGISEMITQSIAPRAKRLKIWEVKKYGAQNRRSNMYLIRIPQRENEEKGGK